jgi:hypothetical protein
MKTMTLDAPVFAFIVATRAALAGGIGLLLSEKLSAERRRALGTALLTIGAATTIPAVYSVVRGLRRSRNRRPQEGVEFDPGLIGASRYPRKGDDYVE